MNPLLYYLRLLIRGIEDQIVQFGNDFGSLISNLWKAFPNLYRMADILFEFSTSFVGRIVALPFSALESYIKDLLKAGKLGNRLIRVDDAVHLMFLSFTTFSQTITFTGSNSILGALAGWFARFVWNLFKRVEFLVKLLGVRSEAELVELYVNKVTKRVGNLRVVALIVGSFLVLAWAGAQIMMMGLGIMLFDKSFQAAILPQDSSRRRIRVRSVVRRENASRGKDKRSSYP